MGLTRIRADQISDIDYKQAVRVIELTNVTLAGGAPALVDGVSLNLNDRILVAGQGTTSQNGLYDVTVVGTGTDGTWVRTSDANATGEINAGMIVAVTEGLTYADTLWMLITDNPIDLGVTGLVFQQTTGNGGAYGNANVSTYLSSGNVTTNILTTGNISATGNITTGGNIITTGTSGNISGADYITANVFSATGNVYGANISALGNITAGNINTSGAGGNISGANYITANVFSATGNITGSYIIGNGSQLTGLPAGYSNADVATYLSSGNVTTNILTTAVISASGNIFGGGIRSTTSPTPPSTPSVGDFWYDTTTNAQYRYTFDGTDYFWLDDYGSSVGIDGTFNQVVNGTSNVSINSTNANVSLSVNGTSNVVVWSGTNQTIAGNIIPSANNVYSLGSPTAQWASVYVGNATLYLGDTAVSANNVSNSLVVNGNTVVTASPTGNSSTTGNIVISGNVTATNILTAGYISATGNITGSYLLGNGSQLTGISTGPGNSIVNGTSNVQIASANGNVTINASTGIVDASGTTGAFNIPTGNTAQRPVSPTAGAMRYNTTTLNLEIYLNGVWNLINITAPPTNSVAPVISGTAAIGQTLTTTNGTWTGSPSGYYYQWLANAAPISSATANTFVLTSGQINANITAQVTAYNVAGNGTPAVSNSLGPVVNQYTVTYLAVAGGGSGGYTSGGGGGGLLANTTTLTVGTTYTITVGAGGASVVYTQGNNGTNSVISGTGLTTITAIGGGGGGSSANGNSGGSGGGGGYYGTYTGGAGTSGQGFAGGNASSNYASGGGGGAGAVGGNAGSNSGNGGAGAASSITGSSVYYAGGGGGGAGVQGSYEGSGGTGGGGGGGSGLFGPPFTGNPGSPGGTNTGGGGGGAYNQGYNTGTGGSGVVIISAPTTSYSGVYTNATITTSGSNTILTFNTSGTYTA